MKRVFIDDAWLEGFWSTVGYGELSFGGSQKL